MTTPDTPEPALEFWDAMPRRARKGLSDEAFVLLSAIEHLRRRAGLTTFEATDDDLAEECQWSKWKVRRTLPELRGTWIDWESGKWRRKLTILYRLKGLDEAPKMGAQTCAKAPTSNRRKRPCLLAQELPFPIEEPVGACPGNSELEREETSTSRQRVTREATPETGRDDFASLPTPKPEEPQPESTPPPSPAAPPPDASAEVAKMTADLESKLANLRPGSSAHSSLRRELRVLQSNGFEYQPVTPRLATWPIVPPQPTPKATPIVARAALTAGYTLDESSRLLRLGRDHADGFAAYHAKLIGEPDNPETVGLLRDCVLLDLRPDWVVKVLRQASAPGVRCPGKLLSKILAPACKAKRQTLKGARP